MLRLLKETDAPVTLHVGNRHILFSIDRYTLISRLLEGEFLDYRSAIPKEHATEGLSIPASLWKASNGFPC